MSKRIVVELCHNGTMVTVGTYVGAVTYGTSAPTDGVGRELDIYRGDAMVATYAPGAWSCVRSANESTQDSQVESC